MSRDNPDDFDRSSAIKIEIVCIVLKTVLREKKNVVESDGIFSTRGRIFFHLNDISREQIMRNTAENAERHNGHNFLRETADIGVCERLGNFDSTQRL